MRYTADDYIAMRKDANRGAWWTAAILWFALSVGVFLLRGTFFPEGGEAVFIAVHEWYLAITASAGAGVYCAVQGYRKANRPTSRFSDGSDGGGGCD